MTNLGKQLRKYFIMGSQNCDCDPIQILQEAIAGGITSFQYREKGNDSLTGEDKLKLGKQLREVCREANILFFINDDVHLAKELDVDGIHVGQDDMPVTELRTLFPDKIIGLSVSNDEEVNRSSLDVVDYIGAGPMFATSTKEDAKEPVGVEWIKSLKANFPHLPIVGIGGITVDNAYDVIHAGADGVSVISAITKSDNIAETVEKL